MFGHHSAKREKHRLERGQKALAEKEEKFKANEPARRLEEEKVRSQQMEDRIAKSRQEREAGYERGTQRGHELFKQEMPGLDPEARKALQYEGERGIHRSMQSSNRKLLGDQASRGILGKGGVGYAQQRDLMHAADQAKGQVGRDVAKLNADTKMKQLAALFNVGQGEAAQYQLDRQTAADELGIEDERRRQREFEDRFAQDYSPDYKNPFSKTKRPFENQFTRIS